MTGSFARLAAFAAAWTLFVWGGRISLLTDAEAADAVTWLRVGGSLIFGAALALAAIVAWRTGRSPRGAVWLSAGFAAWMVFIWVPDVVALFTDDRTVGFVLVHVGLAGVSLTLAAVLARWAVRRDDSRPAAPSPQRIS